MTASGLKSGLARDRHGRQWPKSVRAAARGPPGPIVSATYANHCLIAYSLSNISAKNYPNRLMCVEVIVCNISVTFLRQCKAIPSSNSP